MKMGSDPPAARRSIRSQLSSLVNFAFRARGRPCRSSAASGCTPATLCCSSLPLKQRRVVDPLMPLYALSYVWVAFLSAYFFGDHINAWKVAGMTLIILGVALLGRANS